MEKDIEVFMSGFGSSPEFKIVTPSRVNIIGEHSDYFDNFVLSMAVENLAMSAYIKPRDDNKIRIFSLNLKDTEKPFFEFSISDDRYKIQWIQYVQGAVAMYAEEYRRRNLKGFDVLIDSTIPVGGGLSSSSALTMTTLAALGIANGFTDGQNDYSGSEGIEIINSKADNEKTQKVMKKFFMMGCWAEYWYGTRGGFNDHLALTVSKKNSATLSDNREKSYLYSPIPEGGSWIVCNTMVKHNQLYSEYDNRKKNAFSAINKLQAEYPEVENARDVTREMLENNRDKFSDLEYRRLKHPVTERERVFAFMESLGEKNFVRAGELLNETHSSLKDDYEVTCKELNIMQEAANSIDGCYGSRMVGGGFGGCIIALVASDKKENFMSEIRDKYNNHQDIRDRGINTEVWEAISGDGIKIQKIAE